MPSTWKMVTTIVYHLIWKKWMKNKENPPTQNMPCLKEVIHCTNIDISTRWIRCVLDEDDLQEDAVSNP